MSFLQEQQRRQPIVRLALFCLGGEGVSTKLNLSLDELRYMAAPDEGLVMRSFYYRPGRNAAAAMLSGSLAALAAWLWWQDGDTIWLISLVVLSIAALKGAANAMNSQPALKFDSEQLWVRTTLGSHAVSWKQVYGIALQILTVRYWGIIPVSRREILCISIEGGSFGARRLRIPAASIELPAGGANALVQILRDAQLAAVGAAGVAMAGAGKNGWGVPGKSSIERDEPTGSGFDADAAIARYLALKKAPEEEAPATPGPLPAAPASPQRPVFGRRQAS